jgi:hypothetical protein
MEQERGDPPLPPPERVVAGPMKPTRLIIFRHGSVAMERIVVTHIRDDLCLVSHRDQTLSAHTTEHEALSVAFAFAARCIQNGDETVVVLAREQGPRRAYGSWAWDRGPRQSIGGRPQA